MVFCQGGRLVVLAQGKNRQRSPGLPVFRFQDQEVMLLNPIIHSTSSRRAIMWGHGIFSSHDLIKHRSAHGFNSWSEMSEECKRRRNNFVASQPTRKNTQLVITRHMASTIIITWTENIQILVGGMQLDVMNTRPPRTHDKLTH